MPDAAKATTYSHLGYRPHTGYVVTGRLFGHQSPERGKTHALVSLEGSGYSGRWRAACGETVPVVAYDVTGTGEEIRGHVRPTESCDGKGVTCARCRKALGLRRWAVAFLPPYCRRWALVKGHGEYRAREEALAALATLKQQYPAIALKVKEV